MLPEDDRVIEICRIVRLTKTRHSLNVLNFNFSKEQCMLPEDDRVIETCRSVLNVSM